MSKNNRETPLTVGRPVCEFTTHFLGSTAYPEPKKPETYHRSSHKALPEGVKTYDLHFLGNQARLENGSAPKTGNYYNPFHFQSMKRSLRFGTSKPVSAQFSGKARPYDVLLEWQKSLANFAVTTLKQHCPSLNANQDNNYPCLLFSLENRGPEKNAEIWSKFVMRYVIAFANILSFEQGLNIELVARSSFDCLRPSISPCGNSVRVSFGLAPRAYVGIVCSAIALLYTYLKKDHFNKAVDATALRKTLQTYNNTHKLKQNKALSLGDSVWESLWKRGDQKGCSFATQLFRTAPSADALTRRIMQAGLDAGKPLSKALNEPKTREKILVEPLQAFFQSIEASTKGNKTSLSVNNTKNSQLLANKLAWDPDAIAPQETAFDSMVSYFLHALDVPEQQITNTTEPGKLYSLLEHILWQKSHHLPQSLAESSQDGYGSDSDTEADACEARPKLYAKKCITATGMRAIQLGFADGRLYLERQHKIDVLKVSHNAAQMYYETEEALSRFAIPVSNSADEKNLSQKRQHIPLIDINHCNTTHTKTASLSTTVPNDSKLCILDVTSATTEEIRQHISTLFRIRANLRVILLVSSGLKNQQAMSDCNPYGEIRIFAKSRDERDMMYNAILELEKAADYNHPKESHVIRKYFKGLGFTLTNASIFASTQPKNDEELQSLELHNNLP